MILDCWETPAVLMPVSYAQRPCAGVVLDFCAFVRVRCDMCMHCVCVSACMYLQCVCMYVCMYLHVHLCMCYVCCVVYMCITCVCVCMISAWRVFGRSIAFTRLFAPAPFMRHCERISSWLATS